jgi:hypothetical protein
LKEATQDRDEILNGTMYISDKDHSTIHDFESKDKYLAMLAVETNKQSINHTTLDNIRKGLRGSDGPYYGNVPNFTDINPIITYDWTELANRTRKAFPHAED